MVAGSRTRYASGGDVDIAYQVLGDGPIDLLMYTGWALPIDVLDDEPALARFQRRLSSFARLIRFDVRGVGLSDRCSPDDPPTLRQWADDGLSVLDAVGSERAVIFAPFRSTPIALILAAEHPDRVRSLILVDGMARTRWAKDYPMGMPEELADRVLQRATDADALEQGFDLLALFTPSRAADDAFRSWWDRSGNMGSTPAMARAMTRTNFETDVRELLPRVRVPTLVIGRAESTIPLPGNSGYLAEHIEGARLVELPGADSLYWTGDTSSMLDEIEEFMTGSRGTSSSERVLATVLFTDVVDSTDRAAKLGDEEWRDLLDRHDHSVRIQIQRFRGREIATTGDGFFVTFTSPRSAIECAIAIRESLEALDIDVRAGVHAGEIEIRGNDLAGMTVHIGARVSALAASGEVLVSSTVKDLVAGSSFEFEERGAHELKGVPGTWTVFAVRSS